MRIKFFTRVHVCPSRKTVYLTYRCLNPGKYAQHLERWLSFYLPQQLHIIDGEQLRQNPVETLHELQRFLKITPAFNYSSHLRYDPKKGFFCQVTNEDRTKCLGKSKGRQYPPMEDRSYKLLQVKKENSCIEYPFHFYRFL